MRRAHALTALLALALPLAACEVTETPADAETDETDGSEISIPLCTRDAECDDHLACNGVEKCTPDDDSATSRGCVRGTPKCVENQVCDEASDTCRACSDENDGDGDGVVALACGGSDCDDNDAAVFPAATEVCDPYDRDEDCDASTFGSQDLDGDGVVSGRCCNVDVDGERLCGGDCDDGDIARRVGQPEFCDALDNDCDGYVDEHAISVPWYDDADEDGFGKAGSDPTVSCTPLPGRSLLDNDCDDESPARSRVGVEVCDGADDDCDGRVDEIASCADAGPSDAGSCTTDLDSDGHADAACGGDDCDDDDANRFPGNHEVCDAATHDEDCDATTVGARDVDRDSYPDELCLNGLTDGGTVAGPDCDDARADVHPSAPERCDGRDNDCDGAVDENLTGTWYRDADGDGVGSMLAPGVGCNPVALRTSQRGDDCDDANADTYPTATERCNTLDEDCDGSVDEGVLLIWWNDADQDGYGDEDAAADGGTGYPSCNDQSPYQSLTHDDCSPFDSNVHPGATEVCSNSIDEDCDGTTDEAGCTP